MNTDYAVPLARNIRHVGASLKGVSLALLAGVSACAVGPNFHRPPPPKAPDYGTAPARGTTASAPGTGGNAQEFVTGLDIPGQWWEAFHSPKLTALVEQSLKANPNIGAAQAALRQANDLYKADRATLFPMVQGSFSALRAKNATATIANPTSLPQVNPYYNLFTAQLDLSYLPDVFGGTRRALEAERAQVAVTRYQLVATYVTLSSNVVTTAVQEAALRGQAPGGTDYAEKEIDIILLDIAVAQGDNFLHVGFAVRHHKIQLLVEHSSLAVNFFNRQFRPLFTGDAQVRRPAGQGQHPAYLDGVRRQSRGCQNQNQEPCH
jgi:hypothetical protein